jgi:hypothetical protein
MLSRQALVVDHALQQQLSVVERDLAARYPSKPKAGVQDLYFLWAAFALPGLMSALGASFGFGELLIEGVILTCVGGLWASICPMSHWFPKHGLSFCGVAVLISAILSIFVPLAAITVVSLFSFPFAVAHIWKVMK